MKGHDTTHVINVISQPKHSIAWPLKPLQPFYAHFKFVNILISDHNNKTLYYTNKKMKSKKKSDLIIMIPSNSNYLTPTGRGKQVSSFKNRYGLKLEWLEAIKQTLTKVAKCSIKKPVGAVAFRISTDSSIYIRRIISFISWRAEQKINKIPQNFPVST